MKKTKIISLLLSMTMLLTAIVPGTFAGEDTSGANVSEPIVVEEKETALDRIKSGINSFRDIVDAIGNTFDDIGDFVTSFGNAASANDGDADTNTADDQQQGTEVCDRCGQEDCICCTECNGIGTHETTCSAYQTFSGEQTSDTLNEYACSCEYPPESGNISEHAESCVRKTYILSQFNGKTPAEIYAQWETYDEATRADILQMVSVYDSSKYNELIALIKNGESSGEGGSDEDITFEEYPETIIDGLTVGMSAKTGVFHDDTVASVQVVDESSAQTELASAAVVLVEYLSDYTVTVISQKVVDISFTLNDEEVQPQGSVYVTFEFTTEAEAEHIAIFHIQADGTAELMAIRTVDGSEDVSMTIEADSFSHYVILQSETEYNATLMKDLLKNDDRYSIVTFPVTLNDFDAQAYNNKYNSDGLWFTTGTAGTGMNLGALPATQGIVANTLTGGYPVTHGDDRGSIIFSEQSATGKTVHSNVLFEFIYDNQTGYYSYNSGANHAQYNSDTNIVELYADTLAPFNYRHDVLSKIINSSLTKKVDQGNKNVYFEILTAADTAMFSIKDNNLEDLDTNEYTHLYMRMKSNYSGNIMCRVFYSAEIDGYGSGVDYDDFSLVLQKDKWADYIFGQFDQNKKIRYVRFYLQDGKIGNWIDIDTAGFLRTDNPSEVNFAGFYPFNSTLTNSYSGSEEFKKSTWEKLIQTGDNHQLYSTRVMYNTPFSSCQLTDSYAYFAMAMEVDFYLPNDGKVNGKDIIFNFNGDDDMWVFVDGKLALDIGGLHTDVAGSINFTNGTTYVQNVRSITDTTLKGNGPKDGTLSADQFTKGTYHKIQIFYMERAGTNSNCLIKFNLPVVPEGDVIVSKTVNEKDGYSIDDIDNLTFTFKVNVADNAHADKNYTVETKDSNGNVINTTEKKTNKDGYFTLKYNQTAFFGGIDENSIVNITEISPSSTDKSIYVSTTVNGNNASEATGTVTANGKLQFAFVNTYQALTDIVIEKEIINNFTDTLPENQTFFFRVQGIDEKTKDIDLTVAINISVDDWTTDSLMNSVTIKNVPKGKYKVTEDTDWAWRYTPVKETEMTQNIVGASYIFEFLNERTDPYWLSGDSYCENWWGGDSGTKVVKRTPNNIVIVENAS